MIYKHKKLKLKNILVATALMLSFFCAAFSGIAINLNSVFANSKQTLTSILNGNFNSHSSTRPANPSNWSYLNPNNIDNGLKHGVFVGSEFSNFKEDYKLEENPFNKTGLPVNLDVEKSLMINSYEGHHTAGYQSSTFTLEARGFYSVSVYALSQNNALGTIAVDGLSQLSEQAKISSIINSNWQEYTIFIATSEFSSETLTLQLLLGDNATTSSGAVFFTNVKLIKYSESTFNTELQLAEQNKPNQISKAILSEQKTIAVENGNFEDLTSGENNAVTGFKLLESENSASAENTVKVINANDPNLFEEFNIYPSGTNYSPNNENVLFMHNKTKSYQGIESSDITIKRHTNYKLTVWAKTNSGKSVGPTLKLAQKNVAELENFNEVTKTISVSTTHAENATVNNWSSYSFYIAGHPLQDTVVNLQILLGTENAKTDGYVFIDQIEIQTLSSSQYEKGISDSNIAEFNYTSKNTQFNITNGNFNLINNANADVSYPSNPKNWTIQLLNENTNENYVLTGVVSTTNSDFDLVETKSENIGLRAINPGLTPNLDINKDKFNTLNTPNNVLMMGQTTETTQTVTSSELSLSESEIYKLTFSANTQLSNTNGVNGASFALLSQGNKVFELLNINTENTWKTYTIYIRTNQQLSTVAELKLNNVTGYVFYDDFRLQTATEEEFNAAKEFKSSTTHTLDLQVEEFNNFAINTNQALNTAFNWSVSNSNTSTTFGILNTNMLSESEFSYLDNPQPTNGENVLFARSLQDDIITLSTSSVYKLNEGSYNKVVVRIKTYAISQEDENKQLNENGHPILPGVMVKLDTYQEHFTAINTQQLNNTNVNNWIDLEFFINTNQSLEIRPEISLGYEGAKTAGTLFVDTIKVLELDEAEYKEQVGNIENSKTQIVLTELVEEDVEEDVEETPRFEGGNFDFVLVSSIIMSLALLAALVASGLRRIKITRKPKIKTTYDRKRTLELQLNKKERIEFRREIIDNLQLEFDTIDKEIREFIAENELKLQQLREKHSRKTKKYDSIKQAIVLEIDEITKQHNELSKYITDRDQIKLNKESFDRQIAKLKLKQSKAEKKSQIKQSKLEQLQSRRKRYLEKQEYRRQLIEQEIAKIEREIEEIAKEEEIMWSEYRKAKEIAKQQKYEYYSKLREEKRAKRIAKKEDKQLRKQQKSKNKQANKNNKDK